MELRNHTPFLAERFVVLDKRGTENLVVAVKGTWDIAQGGELSPSGEQEPICPVEEFHGEPDISSVRREGELGLPKPATDVFLRGAAISPVRAVPYVDVICRIGPVSQSARIFGERVWRKSGSGVAISSPRPFDAIPLIWENAYGGEDDSPDDPRNRGFELRNPVGRGFRAKESKRSWDGALLPNIEDPLRPMRHPDDRVDPVGFGPTARSWMPRRSFAGTYDPKWVEERMPLLPEDFDDRFHNAAPPGLVVSGFLRGGEPVDIAGCTKPGRLSFHLPTSRPTVTVRFRDREVPVAMEMNTVTVDTERLRLHLLWKGQVHVHREVVLIREIGIHADGG